MDCPWNVTWYTEVCRYGWVLLFRAGSARHFLQWTVLVTPQGGGMNSDSQLRQVPMGCIFRETVFYGNICRRFCNGQLLGLSEAIRDFILNFNFACDSL